jgi:hypothetical protein
MVMKFWEIPISGDTLMHRWNNKMCALRKHLSSWARHIIGLRKIEKQHLSSIIDDLKALAKVRSLIAEEIELKSQIMLEGDLNTYFHKVANGRHRKKLIHVNLKSYITNYYKVLFGASKEGNFSLDESISLRFSMRKAAYLRHLISRMK